MARMYTTSSGTGDLDLIPVAGEAPYSGNDAVDYSIHTPLGAYETGTASVVGGKRLVGRTVVTSSNANALISVPQPPTAVSIYLDAQVGSAEGDDGAGLVDANYGDITVSDDGTAMTINAGAVSSDKLGGDIGATGVSVVTASDGAGVRAAAGIADGSNISQDDFVMGDDIGAGYPVITFKSPAQARVKLSLPDDPSDSGFLLGHSAPTTSTVLAFYAPFPGVFSTAKRSTTSGTCTDAVSINGTPVTGFGSGVTSSADTDTATAAHTFAKGDKIAITFPAASSPVDYIGTFNFDRI